MSGNGEEIMLLLAEEDLQEYSEHLEYSDFWILTKKYRNNRISSIY